MGCGGNGGKWGVVVRVEVRCGGKGGKWGVVVRVESGVWW